MDELQSLRDLIARFRGRGDSPALISFHPDGRLTISYRALAGRISRIATDLRRSGVNPGETILLIGPNSPEWIGCYFGIVAAGAIAVPLDDQWGADDVFGAVKHSGARHAFASPQHAAALTKADALPADRVYVMNAGADAGDPRRWEEVMPDPDEALPALDQGAVASLLYTSGTTGTPKGVPLTHRNFLANLRGLLAEELAGPNDRVAIPLPFHHAYPFTVGLLTTLAVGASVILPADLSGPALAHAFKEGRATILIGVPRLYGALLAGIEARIAARGARALKMYRIALRASRTLRPLLGIRAGRLLFRPLHREIGPDLRLLASGGAPLDPATARRLEELGWRVLIGYGLTEAGPILTFNPPDRARIDSAGFPLRGIEIRIERNPEADFGEILARGPNIFGGYRNNPEATRDTLTSDGWLRTGDLGFVDRGGRLHIVGRLKEMIVLAGGKKVFPEAIEKIYKESPLIEEIAILEDGGTLVALVVPDRDEIRTRGGARAAALVREEIETISGRLPPYQRIGAFKTTSEKLPRTLLGKFRRHLLPPLYHKADRTKAEAPPSSDADDPVLARPRAREIWGWLQTRFPEQPLSLGMSPQLDLHVDSLAWVSLTLEIQDRFGVALPQQAVGRIVTLRDLVDEIASAAPSRRAAAGTTDEAARHAIERGPLFRMIGTCVFALNRCVMRLLFRLEVAGTDHVPPTGAVIIAPNHASFLDPLAIAAALPPARLRETYWAGWVGVMFRGPLSRLLSRSTNVFPVDADRDPTGGVELGLSILGRGRALVWFPEGRRSPTNELQEFMAGVGILAKRSGAPVVPTLLSGTFEAWPPRRRFPRLHPIRVVFGPPLSIGALAEGEDEQSAAVAVAAEVRRAVGELGATPRRNSRQGAR